MNVNATWRGHTFGVFFNGLLQVLHDAVVADDLLDLALGVDVEGIFVEQGDLVLALTLGALLHTLHLLPLLSPAGRVVECVKQLRALLTQRCLGGGVVQDSQSHSLWVDCSRTATVTRTRAGWSGASHFPLPLRPGPAPPDEHSQHLAILDTRVRQCLCLGAQRAAVEEEVLRVGGEGGVGFDERLEVLDGEVGRHVERQQVLVGGLVGRVDGYGDAWPVGAMVRNTVAQVR
jgi:hypothetical protein